MRLELGWVEIGTGFPLLGSCLSKFGSDRIDGRREQTCGRTDGRDGFIMFLVNTMRKRMKMPIAFSFRFTWWVAWYTVEWGQCRKFLRFCHFGRKTKPWRSGCTGKFSSSYPKTKQLNSISNFTASASCFKNSSWNGWWWQCWGQFLQSF